MTVMPGVSGDKLAAGVKKADLGFHHRGSGRQAGTRDEGMGPSVEVWLLLSRLRQEEAAGQEEKKSVESLRDLMGRLRYRVRGD